MALLYEGNTVRRGVSETPRALAGMRAGNSLPEKGIRAAPGFFVAGDGKPRWNAFRAISKARLRTSPSVRLPPIDQVVSLGPYHLAVGESHLGIGFPLRCFQRLSVPDLATRRCRWSDNRYTRGPFNPVLSY